MTSNVSNSSGAAHRSLSILLVGAIFLTLSLSGVVSAQSISKSNGGNGGAQTINAGTTIEVRTTGKIEAKDSDGLIFPGVVDKAVLDRSGRVAIPAGSDVELIVREISDNEVALDLDAITVNNQRFSIDAEDSITTTENKDGIGANGRTGKYVGGGAIIGAVIGAIAGGGKGAAIGAGVGAAGGAGAQVLTRGRNVSVPAESLLTFTLQEPLRTGLANNTVVRNGRRYREGYPVSQINGNPGNGKTNGLGIGNGNGNNGNNGNNGRGNNGVGNGNVRIGRDNRVSWQAPTSDARVFVLVDNEPRKLFAQAQSGTESAPWITEGHRYIFVLVDSNNREIGRDELDLRRDRSRR